jgi:hypothetical protein
MSGLADTPFKSEYHGMVEPGVRMFWLVKGTVSLVAPTTEDAKRVAACWNACAGIPTDELLEQVSRGRLIKLSECMSCKQRDELLLALADVLGCWELEGILSEEVINKVRSCLKSYEGAL